jgi:hypothetical protein
MQQQHFGVALKGRVSFIQDGCERKSATLHGDS